MANENKISQIQVGSVTYDIHDAAALPSNADANYALAIKDQSNESNILTVGWDGTMTHDGDIPWTNLPLTSNVVAFSDGQVPIYRKWGPVVTVCGAVKMASAQSADFNVQISQLPVGCRPKKDLEILCQGSSREIWLLLINAGGVMYASRYRRGDTAVAVGTSTWFPFIATFLVA